MTEQTNNGELLLPICIHENEIPPLLSALDLWRILSNGGDMYAGFEAVLSALEFIDNPENSPCLDIGTGSSGACYRFDMTSDVWELYPNNPYDPSDDRKTLLGMSWRTFSDIVDTSTPEWLEAAINALGERVGYFPNDLFIDYTFTENVLGTAFAQLQAFYDAVRQQDFAPFPRAHMTFEGTGQVEVEFCQAPFGGSVIITWDFQPELNDLMDIVEGKANSLDNFEIIELDRDVFQVPFELVSTLIWEHEFDVDETHNIWCYFIPSASLEPPFLRPFMGIRESEFCGQIKVIGQTDGTEYDKTNYQYSTREGVIKLTLSYEQMLKAIREGNNLSKEDMAKRILLAQEGNVLSGISIEADDRTLQLVENAVDKSPVLPTGISQTDISFGGTVEQANGFLNLFKTIKAQQTAGLAATIIQRGIRTIMGIDETATDAVTAVNGYITSYINQTQEFVVDARNLARDIFFTGEPTQGVLERSIADYGTDEPKFNLLNNFAQYVSSATWDRWFNDGISIPDESYKSDSRYRLPTQTFKISVADGNFNGGNQFYVPIGLSRKNNRRWLVKISGKITGTDTATWDGMYSRNASNALSYAPIQWYNGNGSEASFPDVQPNESNSGYSVYFTHNDWQRLAYNPLLPTGQTYTGEVTMVIVDLGAQ